ncbi:MAG: rane carboxypeptidase (penicillin-binding protein) [Actinomycetia bacterium]|nr:rane carboxypeptidase (penicillin-binding protein) [Actinomycetes bacterium]
MSGPGGGNTGPSTRPNLELSLPRLLRFLAVIVAGGVLTAITATLLVPQVGTVLTAHSADPVQIDLDPLAQRSIVLAANGTDILAALHREENRKVVPLSDIPGVLVATVLAVEDASFYDHGGVDVRSMVRAMFANVKAGDVRQGGSTITQQLVKNALLDSKQDFSRKIKEAVLSVRLEHQLSKKEILERYLNTVYLGSGAYGVQAAAETYFGKNAKDLDQADSALLAGMIKNPVGYDPYRFPDAAAARRAEVVGRLRRVGAIDEVGAAGILFTPLPTEMHSVLPKPNDYFVNEVVQRLLDDKRLGATATERYNALFKGGLTITTTLDVADQDRALAAVQKAMPDTGGKFTSALVSVEPSTGAVRALVGGPGFEHAKYNIATQGLGRQIGSSMKPFVLAAAIDSGISPKSTINGASKCRIPNPTGTPNPYEAENFEGERAGVENLYDATKHSVNCAYLRLGQIVGIPKVIDMAHRLGVTAPLADVPSLPLGVSEVRPIDMAAAYATFANDGLYNEPYLVEQVKDRQGKVIYQHKAKPTEAISPEVAHEVTDVLKGVITGGTGTAARFKDRRPAAGKTGTTADHGDAWFVGYTRELSTAVWMGSPVGRVPMKGVAGVRVVTGGTFPARIWQAFMGAALDGTPIQDFPKPDVIARGTYLKMAGDKAPVRRRRPTTTTVPGAPSTDPTTPTTAEPVPTTTPPVAESPPTGQTVGGA